MQIQEELAGERLHLRLAGELTLNTSPQVRPRFRSCIKQAPEAIIVDLFSVNYIDSAGMATLIEFMRETTGRGGRLLLVGVEGHVAHAMRATRINEVFDIYPSEEAAVLALDGKVKVTPED